MKFLKTLAFFAVTLLVGSLNAQNALTFSIDTDCWGGEVSWQLADDAGTIFASQPNNPYGNQTNYTDDIDLADGCYTLTIADSYGYCMNGPA